MRLGTRQCLATTSLAALLTAGCTGTTTDTPEVTADSPEPTVSAVDEGQVDVAFDTLTGEATRLTVDQSVVDALGSVGVELSATGGATSESAGGATTFEFPVSGGQATIDAAAADRFTGNVEHEGGLQLSALGRNVTADQLVLEDGQLTAMVSGRRVPLLPLPTEPTVSGDDEEVELSWSTGALSSSAVQSLTRELNLPDLPDLQVNSLESTLTG